MSSLTSRRRTYVAPRRGLGRRLRTVTVGLPPSGPLLLAGVAAVVAGCAFVAGGGSQLARTTWTEVALMLGGAGLCALALTVPLGARTPARLRGGWVLAAFGLLAAFTAASINWSLTPAASWLETMRTLSYFAALAGGLALGRLFPGRWSAMVQAMALAAVVICGWGLLTKVFPAALAPDEPFARLRPPFDYWNSVGLAAALGIPPLVWLASRRSGHAAVNALAWPGLGLLVVTLMLSYSRGALLAVALGLALWFAAVPLRLRGVAVLGGVLVATVPLVAWAFAQDGLTLDGPPLAIRTSAGEALGALLLLLCVALGIAGLAVGFLGDHRPPGERTRARLSRTLVAALLAVPAVAVLMLANAPGGLDGQVSKAWRQATDPKISAPDNSPGRLTQTSSVRARYWEEAWDVQRTSPWIGSGADAYGTLRLRFRINRGTVRHAHGYVVQTLADFGWSGLGISLLAVVAWGLAAGRALGVRRRDRGLGWDAERVGLATLAVVVVVFGLHSTLDWTWFIPGNAVPALLCAGFVASRGPLRERLGAVEPVVRGRRSVPAVATAAIVVALAGVASWSALQPVRAAHAQDAALDRLAQGALPQAASIARIAHERDPLSIDPLFELSAIETARGRTDQARRALEQAVDLEPANPETWRRLGRLRLGPLKDPKGALRAFQAAYYLDPQSAQSVNDVVVAARAAA